MLNSILNSFLFYLIAIPFIAIALLRLVIKMAAKKSAKKTKRRLEEIANSSPYRRPLTVPKPNNDFLARNQKKESEKQIEEEKNIENGVVKYDPMGLAPEPVEEKKIVGVVEPKGFWSKFVISQKIGYIIARMNAQESGKGGFWTHLIKAQSASQGKDQSRGR